MNKHPFAKAVRHYNKNHQIIKSSNHQIIKSSYRCFQFFLLPLKPPPRRLRRYTEEWNDDTSTSEVRITKQIPISNLLKRRTWRN